MDYRRFVNNKASLRSVQCNIASFNSQSKEIIDLLKLSPSSRPVVAQSTLNYFDDVLSKAYKTTYRIIMFISFKLEEVETRYHTTKWEALAVVRYLAEVRCFVMGHVNPVMFYTDHQALETILKIGTDSYGRLEFLQTAMVAIGQRDYLLEQEKTNLKEKNKIFEGKSLKSHSNRGHVLLVCTISTLKG